MASTAQDYLSPGRSALFERTGSGVVAAYTFFEAGLSDANCSDCATSSELTFLHALSKTILLFVDQNDLVVADSLFELAEEFGVTFAGDTLDALRPVLPVDANDCYFLPADADPSSIRRTLVDAVLPQVSAIVAELDSITDSPTRFVVRLTPKETGLLTDLEVDYGDVLVLKGLLLAYQALLQMQMPYDLKVDIDPEVWNRYAGDGKLCREELSDANLAALLGVPVAPDPDPKRGLLEKYPHLLTVLPTPNDANDGPALLAQARQDLIGACTYWLDAIDYLSAEDDPPGADPQEDELLYLDPNALPYIGLVYDRLTVLRDSLQNGTTENYTIETAMRYDVYDANMARLGELVLIYDFTGQQGREGWFNLADGNSLEVDRVEISPDNVLVVEMHSPAGWTQAWLEGTVNADRTGIVGATYESWGEASQTLGNVTGLRTDSAAWAVDLNPNPLFGGPAPLSPRQLLPQLAGGDEIVPGTFGHGLGDDPTLGGLVPAWRQEDWSELFEIPAPVYRFWSPTRQRHFYTLSTPEKDKLLSEYAHAWTFEGVAYYAYVTGCKAQLVPVYRFWSGQLGGHFYTVDEAERDKLLDAYSHIWTYESIAFYAYPEGRQPPTSVPVWRFWSDSLQAHFFTAEEAEKNKLIDEYAHVWTFEGIAWYVDSP